MAVMNGSRRMLSGGIPSSRCIIVLLPATLAFAMSSVAVPVRSQIASISPLMLPSTISRSSLPPSPLLAKMMREMTSSPRAICRLYSLASRITRPVRRSTSHTVTVVVPMSMASPQSGASAAWASDCTRIRRAPPLRSVSKVSATHQSEDRRVGPSWRICSRDAFSRSRPVSRRKAVHRRLQSSV